MGAEEQARQNSLELPEERGPHAPALLNFARFTLVMR